MSEFLADAMKKRYEEMSVRKWWGEHSQVDYESFGA